MKPSSLFLLVTVSLVMLPQTAQGQRIAPSSAFAQFRPAATPPPARPASFIHRAPDYRWEGIIIGAIAGGLYFGMASRSLACDGGSCFPGILYFAAVGATAGGLFGCFVGMFIPKHRSASPS